MILKVALFIFMLLHVITFTILTHAIFEMQEQVHTMRNGYKDMLKYEIKTTRECFDHWGECVNALTEAVQLHDDVRSKEGAQRTGREETAGI